MNNYSKVDQALMMFRETVQTRLRAAQDGNFEGVDLDMTNIHQECCDQFNLADRERFIAGTVMQAILQPKNNRSVILVIKDRFQELYDAVALPLTLKEMAELNQSNDPNVAETRRKVNDRIRRAELLMRAAMEATPQKSEEEKWVPRLTSKTWGDPIQYAEIIEGKDHTAPSKIRVAFQIFHTEVKNLTPWKCHRVDQDQRRPIYATEFNSQARYVEWVNANGPLLEAAYINYVDKRGKQYFRLHVGMDVQRLMCFSAWLAHVVPAYKFPRWCTARAWQPTPDNWQVGCWGEATPEDIVRIFNEGADKVDTVEIPDLTEPLDPDTVVHGNCGATFRLADSQQHNREQYLKEVEAESAEIH